jgi:hypothetical protein
MKRSVLVLGVVGASALGLAAALLSRPGPPSRIPKQEGAPPAPETRSDPTGVGELELRIQQLERRAIQVPSPAASAATGVPPAASPSPSSEESDRSVIDLMRAREAQVASEPDDRLWSREAAAALRKQFEDWELGPISKWRISSAKRRHVWPS